MKRLLAIAALLLSAQAFAGIGFTLAPNYDATLSTKYPSGNKPQAGCTSPTGYTVSALGDASGEICQQSASEFDFSVLGSNTTTNVVIAYKDAGAGDVQIEGRATDSFAGATDNFAGIGIGVRETALNTSWMFQCKSMLNPTNVVQCQYGTGTSQTSVNCAASGTARPIYYGVTYDVSTGDVKGFSSTDGSTWSECASTNRAMSDVIGYMMGGSRSTTQTLTATMDNYALGSTIDMYTPSTPPGGAPTLTTPISDQTGTQGDAFNLSVADNFSGETSYSVSGLAGSTGVSFNTSTGLFSGSFNSNDVGTRSVTVCGVNGSGSTCDIFSLVVAAVPGDTFTITTSGATSFNCATTSGCGPGDVIVFAGGVHNRTYLLSNLIGTEASPITVRNDTAAGSKTTIRVPTTSGRPRSALRCTNCAYVNFTGMGGWSGQPANRCGASTSPNGIQDNNETDVDEYRTGCGIHLDGTTNEAAQDLFLLQGRRDHITVEGFEMSGDWSGQGDTTYNEGHSINTNDGSYCMTDDPDGWVENITVRSNYLHNNHDTSMYIGANASNVCDGIEGNTLPLRNIVIEYNVWDTIGEGGAKVKRVTGSDPNSAIWRYNRAHNGGGSTETTATGHNSHLLTCFEASCYAYGNVLNGVVTDGKTGSGMNCSTSNRIAGDGQQVCKFENNVIIDTSGHGISSNKSSTSGANVTLQAENNTLVDVGRDGDVCIQVSSSVTGSGYVRDNICAGNTSITSPSNTPQTNNRTGTVASQNFSNAASDNYRLTSSSPARNAANSPCPAADADGLTRPQGSACDQGAYEYDE